MAGSREFVESNREQWRELLDGIFPNSPPKRAEWADESTIASTLDDIGEFEQQSYMLLDPQGSLDLYGAELGAEGGTIEFFSERDQSAAHVVRPTMLTFEYFGDDYLQWSYFRLEYEALPPTGVYEERIKTGWEELLEKSPKSMNYEPRGVYDRGFLGHDPQTGEEIPLPDESRLVSRQLDSGVIVIVPKGGPYNHVQGHGFHGPHTELDADALRSLHEDSIAELENTAGDSPVDWWGYRTQIF